MLPSSAFVFIEPTLYHISECKENKDLRQLVAEVLKNETFWKRSKVLISISGLSVLKKIKIEQKNNKTLVYCSKNDYICTMTMDLEHISNIPVSTSAIASLFSEMKAGNQKVRSLEAANQIIRLKKGLYVVSPKVSRVALSTELIANHLYAPSYVSMQTALRYYGLIPEAVYTTQSMTIKHSRNFDTPIGHFEYQKISREAFPIGVTYINKQSYCFLIATPEKALCDLIANSTKVNLRYLKDVEIYLEEDIRMDIDRFRNMDATVFERYAQVGKKSKSVATLIKYLNYLKAHPSAD